MVSVHVSDSPIWFTPSYQVSVDNSDSEFICVNYVDDASFLCPIPGRRRIDG